MLVTSLLLQEGDKAAGNEGKDNPAIQNCIAMIDELFARHKDDPATIEAMKARINAHRLKFTKKVRDYTTTDGLFGALQLLDSGFISSKPGTRLDYIIATFSSNLTHMKQLLPYSQEKTDEFQQKLKAAIIGIG